MRQPNGVAGWRGLRTLRRVLSLMAVIGVLAGIMPMGAFAAGYDPDQNKTGYWEDLYSDHKAVCFKHDSGDKDFKKNLHGEVSSNGKQVKLKPFDSSWGGDHWEALIIKAGTKNAVYRHPEANKAYASPDNKSVSHWIVCVGTNPTKKADTPTWTVKPETQKCDEKTGNWVGQKNGRITLKTGKGYTWATSPLDKTGLAAGEYGPYSANANSGYVFEGGSKTFSTGKIVVEKYFQDSECLKKVTPKDPTVVKTTGCDVGYFKIHNTEGVDYFVNGELRAPGVYHETGTFTVTAQAREGYKLSNPSWSKTFTISATEKCVNPVAPTVVPSEACDQQGYVLIPNIAGIKYHWKGEWATDLSGQTISGPINKTLVAKAASGWTIEPGATTEWKVEIAPADECIDDPGFEFGNVLMVCNPKTGEFQVSELGFINLDEGENYTWDGSSQSGLTAGTYGPFTATAEPGFSFQGGKTFTTGEITVVESFDEEECDKLVKAAWPIVVQSEGCDIEGFVKVPNKEGVDYYLVDGETETLVNGQTLTGAGTYVIVARAQDGYELEGKSRWTLTVEKEDGCLTDPLVETTPELLVCNPLTGEFEGQNNGSITLLGGENFSWQNSSMTGLSAGTYGPFTAKADEGFVFQETGSDTFVVASVTVGSEQQTENCVKLPLKFACDATTGEVIEVDPSDARYEEAYDTRQEALADDECTSVLPTVVTTPPDGDVDDDELPFTGMETGLVAGIAALLLAIGAAMLLMTRRLGDESNS